MFVEIQTAGIRGVSGIELAIAIGVAILLFLGGSGHGWRNPR
jgi:hypothetical protein